MERRAFGRTGLYPTVLGFGAGHIGGENHDQRSAGYLLSRLLDAGINFIDTARGYGNSEERIGNAISHRRDEFILSSKCGYGVEGTPDWTGECITKGIDQALVRLRTDRIDIMHLHSCEREILDRGEVIGALEAAKEAGKVRFIAYSGENENLEYALNTHRFDSIQTSINLCDQGGIDKYLAVAQGQKIGVVGKRPIANAFWRFKDRPEGDYSEEYWSRAHAMELAEPDNMEWAEFALRWAISVEEAHTLIMGTGSWKHLEEAISYATKGPLPSRVYESVRTKFKNANDGWTGQV